MINLDRDPIVSKYRAEHPIVADFLDTVAQEMLRSPISLDNERLVETVDHAVQTLAKEQGPEFDVMSATQYLQSLFADMAAQVPPSERGVCDFVAISFLTRAGIVPTSADWRECDPSGCVDDVFAIVADIPDDQLRRVLGQTLFFAMPPILDVIAEHDPFKRSAE
jgi:hypothetical protein